MDNLALIPEVIYPPLVLNPPPNVTKVTDWASFEKLIEFLDRTPEFGFDLETTPTRDFFYRRVRTLQFGNSTEQYVIDLLPFCGGDSDLLYNCQGEYGKNVEKAPAVREIAERLRPFLSNAKFCKTGVNLSFECLCMYWSFGERTYGYYDTLLAEKSIYAGLGGKASLKNYEFYSLASMTERYFQVSIDKTLQTSFTLEGELTEAQFEYAALDTRAPIAIKSIQKLIADGETVTSLKLKGKKKMAEYLSRLDQSLLGDNLNRIIKIENESMPAWVFMHAHGERLDTEKWLARVNSKKELLEKCLQNLDKIFLPWVGSKNDAVDDAAIAKLESEWKTYNVPTDQMLEVKKQIRLAKKLSNIDLAKVLEADLLLLETERKAQKEVLKEACATVKKKRTLINRLASKCEGEALINYSSNAQLLKVLKANYKTLAKLETLDDEILEKYEHIPAIKLIREYHGLAKQIGTYGDAWAQCWVTHPCKEEGWISPGDKKIHSEFNQLDAETGRSSSSKPNGQNIEQDKEVRSCFIADPPDEKYPDGYKLITIDMSGAELRILAEEANDPIWLKAFQNEEDVHSVCTELVNPESWPKLALPDCAYFELKENGEPKRHKCKCPAHNSMRNDMKPTNFGLPYGIGPRRLSQQIGKSYKETVELMAKHKAAFPYIWDYLADSGMRAKLEKKSFDMFGRRRLFPEPTWELAKERAKDDLEKQLRLPSTESDSNLITFEKIKGRKPIQAEEWVLTHRLPNNEEISKAFQGMYGSMERQGKNHRIQGTNATICKICMGAGYDEEGKPFLWHLLPKYDSKLVKMVHDELVIQSPTIYAQEVAETTQDCIKRAAAMAMKKISMESEFRIENYWSK